MLKNKYFYKRIERLFVAFLLKLQPIQPQVYKLQINQYPIETMY